MTYREIERYAKWALEVVKGKVTLDKVRRRFPSVAEYYKWYHTYYLAIANANDLINTVRTTAAYAGQLNQGITEILNIWLTEGGDMDPNAIYDYTVGRDFNVTQREAVKFSLNSLEQYVNDVGWNYRGEPTVWASINQLKQASIALARSVSVCKKIFAVLTGALLLEDF